MDLRNFLLFKNLSEEEEKLLKPSLIKKKYKSGDMIFKEGELGADMCLIKEGKVKIYLIRGEYELELSTLESGDFFGEMALLRVYDRSANVVSIDDSEVFLLSVTEFKKIMDKKPEISVKILTSLCNILADRLAETNNNLETHFLLNKAIVHDKLFRDLYITKVEKKGKK